MRTSQVIRNAIRTVASPYCIYTNKYSKTRSVKIYDVAKGAKRDRLIEAVRTAGRSIGVPIEVRVIEAPQSRYHSRPGSLIFSYPADQAVI